MVGNETRASDGIALGCQCLPGCRERFEQREVVLELLPQRLVVHRRRREARLKTPQEVHVDDVRERVLVLASIREIPCVEQLLHARVQHEESPHQRIDGLHELRTA